MVGSIAPYLTFPRKAIIAFVNPKKGKVLISYTKDSLWYITNTIVLLRDNFHKNRELQADADDLEVVMIQDCSEINLSTLGYYLASCFAKEWTSLGWTHYRLPITPHPKVKVYPVPIDTNHTNFEIRIYLTWSKKRVLLKSFKTIEEANAFISNKTGLQMLYEADLCVGSGVPIETLQ